MTDGSIKVEATAEMNQDVPARLEAAAMWSREWLFDIALPLWWKFGADHLSGGFHDKLGLDARPAILPKRVRVQTRQIFVFAEAARIGWSGPAADAIAHGLDFLPRYKRADGLYRVSVDSDGSPVVDTYDLYDQAFVIFALAAAYRALGRPLSLKNEALNLLESLDGLLKHPVCGYDEAKPRVLPLRSNPHMHLLEAVLAWVDAGERDVFLSHAEDLVGLALKYLIDPETGAVGEFYSADWAFASGASGASREPGHQFEWAYLLDLAGRHLGQDFSQASMRLEKFGSSHGIVNERAVFGLDATGKVTDPSYRLWAQSEWLRTMLTLAPRIGQRAMIDALSAFESLRGFLDPAPPGLWRERTASDGSWIDEPSPASSLYHIMTGMVALIER